MHLRALSSFTLFLLLVVPASTERKRKSRSKQRKYDETIFMNPVVKDMFRQFILTGSDMAQDKLTPVDDHQDSLPQFEDSCPSTLFMRYNPSRTPSITFEKHCTQRQCRNLHQSPFLTKKTMSEPRDDGLYNPPTCRKVAYYRWVRVMSQTTNGRRRTEPRLLEIPVGCSCSVNPLRSV